MGANETLGLPRSDDGKMQKVLVAFDVDGTLIGTTQLGAEQGFALMLLLARYFIMQPWKNVDVIIWSGGGADYARTVCERHDDGFRGRNIWHSKLEYLELRKRYDKIIAFDDIQDTRLGDVNLIVRNK